MITDIINEPIITHIWIIEKVQTIYRWVATIYDACICYSDIVVYLSREWPTWPDPFGPENIDTEKCQPHRTNFLAQPLFLIKISICLSNLIFCCRIVQQYSRFALYGFFGIWFIFGCILLIVIVDPSIANQAPNIYWYN